MKQKIKNTIGFPVAKTSCLRGLQVTNWEKYFLGLALVLFSSAYLIIYLTSCNGKQERKHNEPKLEKQAIHIIPTNSDTISTNEKLSKIDKDLSVIDGFLKSHGIKTVYKLPQGRQKENDLLSPAQISNFYSGYLREASYSSAASSVEIPLPNPTQSSANKTKGNIQPASAINSIKSVPVKSVAKGEVQFAGNWGEYGNCVVLKHHNGYQTLYGHLSKITVKAGQKIGIGQKVGHIGNGGLQLLYEVHHNGQKIDPRSSLYIN